VTKGQTILLVDINLKAVLSIDPSTGQRTVVSSNGIAFSGPMIQGPRDVVELSNGNLLLSDLTTDLILRILPNGNREVHSGLNATVENQGVGVGFGEPRGLLLDLDGNLLCADAFQNAIIAVDTLTRDRLIDERSRRGTGPALLNPLDLEAVTSDTLVAVDGSGGQEALIEVNLITGDRRILSGPETGTGLLLEIPYGIAIEPGGSLVVTDQDFVDRVVRVDPQSGNRTLLSQSGAVNGGSGPGFSSPRDLEVQSGGTLLVIDSVNDAVMTVDPTFGDRGILSSSARGIGNTFSTPIGLALDLAGDIFVTDSARIAVFRVDPISGERTVVSDYPNGPNVGNGPHFDEPLGIQQDTDGSLVVVDNDVRAVFRVDPTTGNRMVVSGPDASAGGTVRGTGPFLVAPRFVAIADAIAWDSVCTVPLTPTETPTSTKIDTATATFTPSPTFSETPTDSTTPTFTATEEGGTSTETPTPTADPDVNGDGFVDAEDLLLLLEAWHKEVPAP
jgi:streptogramin lyase